MSIEQKDEKWVASCEREGCGWTKEYRKDYLANRGLNAHKSAHQPAGAPTPTPSQDTQTSGGPGSAAKPPMTIADERANLEQYILECWPSPQAKAKTAGILRHMELSGWANLDALNWALAKASCPVGDAELIIDNWRKYQNRAGQSVVELKGPIGVSATSVTPVEGLTDEVVERELRRLELDEMRQVRMERIRGRGGKSDLADEVRALKDSLTKKEEDRQAREIAELKREIAARAQPAGNVVTRKVPATDMLQGGPLLDADGNPVFIEITEPWAAPIKSEIDVGKSIADAVEKAVGGAMNGIKPILEAVKPHDDPRLASMEAELKAIRQGQEEKKLQEVVSNATGPLYQYIEKQRTEQAVADQFSAKLKEMGIGVAQNPQSQENLAMIKGGFDAITEGMHRADRRMETLGKVIQPIVQSVGRIVDQELGGESGERMPGPEDQQAGERAFAEIMDLPPEGTAAPPPPPARETKEQPTRERVHEL